MRRTGIFSVLLLLSLVLSPMTGTPSARAAEQKPLPGPVVIGNPGGPFGLGLVLGEPVGLSVEVKVGDSERGRMHFILGASLGSWMVLAADAIRLAPRFIPSLIRRPSPLDAYWGLGASLRLSTGGKGAAVELTGRVPLGLDWRLPRDPFGFFLELVPGIRILSTIGFSLEGGVGARYFF